MSSGHVIQNRFQGPFAYLVLMVGICFMVAAAFLLIQGLSRFSGDSGSQHLFIVFGILFQAGESLCFIAAARQSHHSSFWRLGLLVLGIVLFCFSISVMTLAQKATMQVGTNAASALDEQRTFLRNQIESLDHSINSYRFNAEKQSKSIYKDSRALGQDSLNRAIELEQQKRKLSEKLFSLSNERRESSADFFARLENIFGWPAETTEFYFLVLRAFLIELCGVLFLSYGSYSISVLPTKNNRQNSIQNVTPNNTQKDSNRNFSDRKPGARIYSDPYSSRASARERTSLPAPQQSKNVFSFIRSKASGNRLESKRRLSYEESAQAVIAALEAGELSNINRNTIKKYLSVGDEKARKVFTMIKDIQTDGYSDREFN